MKRLLAPLLVLLAAVSLPAAAAPTHWQARPDSSKITFTAYWNGTPVRGRFPAYRLSARLDPAQPTGGSIKLVIATPKLETQSPDITRAVRSGAWFAVADYPRASFTSTSLAKKAPGRFRLRGRLRIKGHTRSVEFPVHITRHNGALTLTGKLALDRTDFSIGSGQWSSGAVIAHRVDVAFKFVLVPGD